MTFEAAECPVHPGESLSQHVPSLELPQVGFPQVVLNQGVEVVAQEVHPRQRLLGIAFPRELDILGIKLSPGGEICRYTL
jgi:hypothetical protein